MMCGPRLPMRSIVMRSSGTCFAGRARARRDRSAPGALGRDLRHTSPIDYDPALARSLLRQAGYSRERIRWFSATRRQPTRSACALRMCFRANWRLSVSTLNISSYDWGTFFGDIKAGRFQLYSLAWVGVNTPDILRYAFHSKSLPPGGANRGGYRSAEVDDLIETAERAAPETARGLYATLQRKIHQDLVYAPLWYEANVSISRGLRGYRPANDGSYLVLSTVEKVDAAY